MRLVKGKIKGDKGGNRKVFLLVVLYLLFQEPTPRRSYNRDYISGTVRACVRLGVGIRGTKRILNQFRDDTRTGPHIPLSKIRSQYDIARNSLPDWLDGFAPNGKLLNIEN